MKRAKYKAKNIHEYKRLRSCTHPECDSDGIVTYWDDPDAEHRKVEHRCIEHVHWIKEPPQVTAAKSPNLYVKMTLPRALALLDPMNYNAGMGKGVIRH